jgi:hypothetical protein
MSLNKEFTEKINRIYILFKERLLEIDKWYESNKSEGNNSGLTSKFNQEFVKKAYMGEDKKIIKLSYIFYEVDYGYASYEGTFLGEELESLNEAYDKVLEIFSNDNDFVLFKNGIYETDEEDNPTLKYSYFWFKTNLIVGLQQAYTNDEMVPVVKPVIFIKEGFDTSLLPLGIFALN